jgi:hypothetical protein
LCKVSAKREAGSKDSQLPLFLFSSSVRFTACEESFAKQNLVEANEESFAKQNLVEANEESFA